MWPPSSPDLNPVDYKIWGIIQEQVYQSWVHSIDELKQRLLRVWHGMDQSIIDRAVDEWRLHLRACVRTRVDTTRTCCDIISMPICTTMWHETFYVVLNMIWFLRLNSVIRGKFELLTFFPFSDFLPICWQEFGSKFILYRWKEGFLWGYIRKRG